MRLFVRVAGAALALLVVAAIGLGVLSEFGGEVAIVRTFDLQGDAHDTRVWVVDWDGQAWLRTRPVTAWYQRIKRNPEVEFVRDGFTEKVRAVAFRDEATRNRVNKLMAADYGIADQAIAVFRDLSDAVPIRLDPVE